MRSVSTSEPRWTELDRAELLALAEYRAGLCPLCGRPIRVCTSHEETGPAFEADYTACRATLAQLEKRRAIAQGRQKPSENAPAYLWTVKQIGGG